jgi:hypothetical protein
MSSGGAILDPRSELSILERHEYEKGLRQIFNLLTIRGDYQVIGSGAIEEIKYGSDYDLQEFVKESDYKKSTRHLLKMFQEKYKKALADPDVFILDFKCGVDDENNAIRWNKTSIRKGHQMVDGRKVTFQECLLMKSTIKMDITALVDGVFIEFSDNYYITLKDFNTFTAVAKSHDDILYSLQHEAEVKYHAGDYWKAMKRIFAYMKSKGGYVPKVKQLVRYFNSTTGLLSKNRSELDIIALIIVNKFRKPRLEDVVNNLQLVRQELSKIHGFKLNDVEDEIDRISKMPLAKMSKPLEEVIAKVKGLVNAHAKRFLEKHTDITALILDSAKLKGGTRDNIQLVIEEDKEGGSKSSGFVQRMIAEKKVKIKKVKDPSKWLQENHKSVSAKSKLIIEEDDDDEKRSLFNELYDNNRKLLIPELQALPPNRYDEKGQRIPRKKQITIQDQLWFVDNIVDAGGAVGKFKVFKIARYGGMKGEEQKMFREWNEEAKPYNEELKQRLQTAFLNGVLPADIKTEGIPPKKLKVYFDKSPKKKKLIIEEDEVEDTFEDKAKKASIELGYEIEKRGEGYEVVYFKSGKKKGKPRFTTLSDENIRKNKEFEDKEILRLAKKYKLPENWDEVIRDKVGNEVVNDWGYIGRDKATKEIK